MTVFILMGISMGFAAAVQPGPTQMFIISRALIHGWRHALPLASAYLISDIPIVTAVLLILNHIPEIAGDIMRLAGGVFLLYLAWGAVKTFRNYKEAQASAQSRVQNLFKAVTINLLNPNPYLTWSLIMGPLLLDAWHENAGSGISVLGSFYGTLVLSTVIIILVAGNARKLGTKINRGLIGVSALALAGFGIYQLVLGITSLI